MSTTTLNSATEPPPRVPDPPAPGIAGRSLPPVLGRLLSGTFWLALRTPLQAVTGFWSVPLILGAFGEGPSGAYRFAWGLGFFQFLLEFGMSSALQREISDRWTRGDRDGVDRAITCGSLFYAVIALVQAVVLLVVAYGAIPHTKFSSPEELSLIARLLWLQALTAPFYGVGVVASCILQAARRYDVMPRFELLIVAIRFATLLVGVTVGAGLLTIVVAQTALQIALGLGPALWVIARELDYRPRFVRVSLDDFRGLASFSMYMFLIQLSVVLADKVDTTVLGFAMEDAARAETVYWAVSSPFLQLRQMGWTLAYFVMPAVASLAAVGDREGLERVTYDGARMHSAAVLAVGLLAFVYAGPFLELWVGGRFPGQLPELVRLMRLFLVAALPLFVAVHVQAATGLGRLKVVAIAALLGGIVNLPLSYALTLRLGVSGVIWGTVATTLFANLLVPAVYTFRVLGVRPGPYARRTMLAPAAGAVAMLLACGLLDAAGFPADPRGSDPIGRMLPFATHLGVGLLAFAAGYASVPVGRSDVLRILDRVRARVGST